MQDRRGSSRNRGFVYSAVLFAIAAVLSLIAVSSASAATFDQTFSNPTADATTRQSIVVSSVGDAANLTRIKITEPYGLNFNYMAFGQTSDMCPSSSMQTFTSTFNPSSCPAQAKIGTITVNLPTGTATGDVYLISKSQFPWLGVDINPSSAPGNPAGLTLRFAFGSSWPFVDPTCDPETNESGWCAQQLQWLSSSLQGNQIVSANITFGKSGRGGSLSGNLFELPSDPCSANVTTKGVLTAANNSSTTVLDNDWIYCPLVPTFNETFSNPTAGALTGVTWDWTNSAGSSNIKMLAVDTDTRLGANIPAFGGSADQCPSSSMPLITSAFDVSLCPSQAKIGTFSINSPDYSGPATGNVYIINKSPVPWLAVNVSPSTAAGNPPGLTLQFAFVPSIVTVDPTCDQNIDSCVLRFRIQSFGLPNVRTTSAQLAFNGPDRAGVGGTLSGKLFFLPSDCSTPMETTARFTPFAGLSYSVTDHTSLSGC